MRNNIWTDLPDRDGRAQARATNGHLIARTLITYDGEHRCMVMDGSDDSMPIIHDDCHATESAARCDAEVFMAGWRHLHG